MKMMEKIELEAHVKDMKSVLGWIVHFKDELSRGKGLFKEYFMFQAKYYLEYYLRARDRLEEYYQ